MCSSLLQVTLYCHIGISRPFPDAYQVLIIIPIHNLHIIINSDVDRAGCHPRPQALFPTPPPRRWEKKRSLTLTLFVSHLLGGWGCDSWPHLGKQFTWLASLVHFLSSLRNECWRVQDYMGRGGLGLARSHAPSGTGIGAAQNPRLLPLLPQ